MPSQPLRTVDLVGVDAEECARRIHAFVAARPESANGALEEVEREIACYERCFGMKSEVMAELIRAGKVRETDAYCRWLMLLDRRDRLAAPAEAAR